MNAHHRRTRRSFLKTSAAGLGATAFSIDRPARAAEDSSLTVNADFPGGSVEVERIDQTERRIQLLPADYPQRGWRCWWYFQVTGIEPGETLTLDVGEGVWATPDRACFSLDNETWRHTEPGQRCGKRIIYRQPIDGTTTWFAWGPPFLLEHAQTLVKQIAADCAEAAEFNLCQSRQGHPTPAVKMCPAAPEKIPPYGIWLQARQHAWESGASWVAQGLGQWLGSDDEAAAALRDKARIALVPIMDVDNVQRGAGGKNQQPQDHNRDWSDEPHWRAVAAAQQEILQLDRAGQFDLFIDLHNPGPNNREPFFYVPPAELLSPVGQRNLQRFLDASGEHINGALPFQGRTIVSGAKYDPQWRAISKNWVASHCGPHVVSVTLETPWNTPASAPKGYEEVGRGLGRAIAAYFEEDVRA